MSKIYKIWVHIEEVDENEDHSKNVAVPECLGELDSLDGAVEVVADLVYAGICKQGAR